MTNSIESSPWPLAFRPAAAGHDERHPPETSHTVRLTTLARALTGMQKEALVSCEPGGRRWRMVSDEGPYLNGTDLAPFPLAFFTAGVANGFLAQIAAVARQREIAIRQIELTAASYYTMQGSAVRGDMLGGALPVQLSVRIQADADDAALESLVADAVAQSPVEALLRTPLYSEFSLALNGESENLENVAPWASPPAFDLSDAVFDALQPDDDPAVPDDLVTKLGSGETVFNVEGGAGSSLAAEQKRTLHIRGIATLRDDGLSETRVQLYKPIGSNFRFLCEIDGSDPGGTRAPSPLVYLSAGLAFCYLTQIGRYVAILKHPLQRYAIGQLTQFGRAETEGESDAEPVRTHVELVTSVDADTARRIVYMGERTCFLHAAARSAIATRTVEPPAQA
jgi:uncharacterized OsmC-like protein